MQLFYGRHRSGNRRDLLTFCVMKEALLVALRWGLNIIYKEIWLDVWQNCKKIECRWRL